MERCVLGNGLLQIGEEELDGVVHRESISLVYDVEKTPLGRGKYATVCRAVHRKTGVQYAAKFVKKHRRNKDQMNEIIHEIAVLKECADTARVIRLHEVYESPTEMVLVLELAAGGELQHILDGGQCLGETEARRAMKQILDGVNYLHQREIAHLDLKPQNLLLTNVDSCEDIKLCDFGISKVVKPGIQVREILGTVDYVAPEVLSYEPISLATDVWSIGVLSYVLLSGFSPFGADDKQQTFLNISKCALSFEPDHFGDVSNTAIDFIKSALVIDPRNRPSVNDLLNHPWISAKVSIVAPISVQVSSDALTLTPPSTPLVTQKSLLSGEPTSLSLTAVSSHQRCLKAGEVISSPGSQRRSSGEPAQQQQQQQRTTFCTDSYKDSPSVCTYTVTANCLCPQCGPTCRHLTHTPVSKTTITVDRGILC